MRGACHVGGQPVGAVPAVVGIGHRVEHAVPGHDVGVTVVDLSVLKNGRARRIRSSTLTTRCEVLRCRPGDLLSHRPG
ncbi:helix-turn-helix domain-containing protein [Saccharothrix isguenensis]